MALDACRRATLDTDPAQFSPMPTPTTDASDSARAMEGTGLDLDMETLRPRDEVPTW